MDEDEDWFDSDMDETNEMDDPEDMEKMESYHRDNMKNTKNYKGGNMKGMKSFQSGNMNEPRNVDEENDRNDGIDDAENIMYKPMMMMKIRQLMNAVEMIKVHQNESENFEDKHHWISSVMNSLSKNMNTTKVQQLLLRISMKMQHMTKNNETNPIFETMNDLKVMVKRYENSMNEMFGSRSESEKDDDMFKGPHKGSAKGPCRSGRSTMRKTRGYDRSYMDWMKSYEGENMRWMKSYYGHGMHSYRDQVYGRGLSDIVWERAMRKQFNVMKMMKIISMMRNVFAMDGDDPLADTDFDELALMPGLWFSRLLELSHVSKKIFLRNGDLDFDLPEMVFKIVRDLFLSEWIFEDFSGMKESFSDVDFKSLVRSLSSRSDSFSKTIKAIQKPMSSFVCRRTPRRVAVSQQDTNSTSSAFGLNGMSSNPKEKIVSAEGRKKIDEISFPENTSQSGSSESGVKMMQPTASMEVERILKSELLVHCLYVIFLNLRLAVSYS